MTNNMFEVIGISKRIKSHLILDNLSFNIESGSICGFLGPNGAGKTTLIRLVTGLIRPTRGSIKINKFDTNLHRVEALKNLGAIVENPIFFSYMTAIQFLCNIGLLTDVKNIRQKAFEVLEIVGLSGRENEKISTYSLGMKQRLGIAQVMLNDPKFIILDEPMNGLDPIGMIELRDLIRKLNCEFGITFFISSHLLDELQKICTDIVIINLGKLAWQGKVNDLNLFGENCSLEDVFMKLLGNESHV